MTARCLSSTGRWRTLLGRLGRPARPRAGASTRGADSALKPAARLMIVVSIALAQETIARKRDEGAAEPPIHWPSAIAGLAGAIMLVVGVSWLASASGAPRRPLAVRSDGSETTAVQPTAIPAAAVRQIATEVPVATPVPNGEQLKVAATRGSGVNLRSGAGERSARVKTLSEGTLLDVIGPDSNADGLVWRNVREPNGNVGWVAATFVTAAGRNP